MVVVVFVIVMAVTVLMFVVFYWMCLFWCCRIRLTRWSSTFSTRSATTPSTAWWRAPTSSYCCPTRSTSPGGRWPSASSSSPPGTCSSSSSKDSSSPRPALRTRNLAADTLSVLWMFRNRPEWSQRQQICVKKNTTKSVCMIEVEPQIILMNCGDFSFWYCICVLVFLYTI